MIKRHFVEFLVALSAGLIFFLRFPEAILNPQFMAEDGLVFFLDAYEKGTNALLMPYGGYLLLVQRVIAWGSMFFDPKWCPTVFNYSSLTLHLCVVAAIFSPRIKLPAKPFFALFLALVPHTGEVLINLSNSNWILAAGFLLLAIADDAKTSMQWILDLLILIICGLSGPFIVFLLPLFLMRAWSRKSRASFVLLAIALILCCIQVSCMIAVRAEFVRQMPRQISFTLSAMSAREFGTFFAGYNLPNVGTSVAWISCGVILTSLMGWLAFRQGPWKQLRLAIVTAFACLALPVGVKFLREPWFLGHVIDGDRYFYLPHLFLGWFLIILAAENAGWKRLLPSLLLIVAVIVNIPHMRHPLLVDYHWADQVQPIREGKAFSIPINPPGWGIPSSGKPTPTH